MFEVALVYLFHVVLFGLFSCFLGTNVTIYFLLFLFVFNFKWHLTTSPKNEATVSVLGLMETTGDDKPVPVSIQWKKTFLFLLYTTLYFILYIF